MKKLKQLVLNTDDALLANLSPQDIRRYAVMALKQINLEQEKVELRRFQNTERVRAWRERNRNRYNLYQRELLARKKNYEERLNDSPNRRYWREQIQVLDKLTSQSIIQYDPQTHTYQGDRQYLQGATSIMPPAQHWDLIKSGSN